MKTATAGVAGRRTFCWKPLVMVALCQWFYPVDGHAQGHLSGVGLAPFGLVQNNSQQSGNYFGVAPVLVVSEEFDSQQEVPGPGVDTDSGVESPTVPPPASITIELYSPHSFTLPPSATDYRIDGYLYPHDRPGWFQKHITYVVDGQTYGVWLPLEQIGANNLPPPNFDQLQTGTVPEPTTWLLFAGGILLLTINRHRQRAHVRDI